MWIDMVHSVSIPWVAAGAQYWLVSNLSFLIRRGRKLINFESSQLGPVNGVNVLCKSVRIAVDNYDATSRPGNVPIVVCQWAVRMLCPGA